MKNKKGFTLIELLVVIAIIALLLSILVPGLQKAKELAKMSVCLANQKALINAWVMYEGDNDGNLVGGVASSYETLHSPSYRGGVIEKAGKHAWIHAPLRSDLFNATVSDLTGDKGLDCRKRGIEMGKLWKYVETHDVYHCPGDRSYKKEPPEDSFVSYAASAAMNGEVHYSNGDIKAYTKTSQIQTSSAKMVFIEENPIEQSWLAGSFVLMDTGTTLIWQDFPAPWHHRRGTVSFADGHAQSTEWESYATRELVEMTHRIFFSAGDKYCLDNPDLQKIVRWYGGR